MYHYVNGINLDYIGGKNI